MKQQLRRLTLDEWNVVGQKLKESRNALFDALFIDNKSLPVGKKWYKNFNKTEKYLGKLRSDLENEFCRQHPDGWSTKVFW